MSHEPFHELIALRLYGEIDVLERAQLEGHLRACAECSRYAAEIESGLGLAPHGAGTRADLDLPSDWTERLRQATREIPARRRVLPWWTVAASFAAGVIATAVIARGPSAPEPAREPLSTWDRFHREEPPPLASTQGQVGRLSQYLRR